MSGTGDHNRHGPEQSAHSSAIPADEVHAQDRRESSPPGTAAAAASGSFVSSEAEKPQAKQEPAKYLVEEQQRANEESSHAALGQPKVFYPSKQLRGLLFMGLLRWLLTAAIIGGLYGVLYHYSSLHVMSHKTKRQFNVLVTGLSIALGLSIASSLKRIATELRWWILSRRERSLREMDMILGIECITRVVQLMFQSTRWTVHLTAAAWLAIHVASQIAVASLALTYTVDAAEEFAVFHPGLVSIANMSRLIPQRTVTGNPDTLGALQYGANSYGTIALGFNINAPFNTTQHPGELWSTESPLVYCGPPEAYCETILLDSAPSPADNIVVVTNRRIRTTTVCKAFPVISGGNGSTLSINVTEQDGGRVSSVGIPIAGGADQTTYMTNDYDHCGPSCSVVYAFEASATDPWFYECNVTIGNVTNASLPEQNVGTNLTSMASAAIALQGYAASSLTLDPRLQYQMYPAESVYGSPSHGDPEDQGLTISLFTTGVLAVAGFINPKVNVTGMTPSSGTTLNVGHWPFVHLILCLSAGIQLILAVGGALIANRVVVQDDSHLVAAHLLRRVVDKVGDGNSMASGKEMAELASTSGAKFSYGAEKLEGRDVYRLRIEPGKPNRHFPKGKYD